MKISVIVPAFNEEKLLPASLRSIQAAAAAFHAIGWDWELIVCDNNSSDRTGELARAAGATVVVEPVNQIARARNRGAAAASGDWLLFVDADSHPSPELFAEVAACIRRGDCVAGGATVRFDDAPGWAHRASALWNCLSRFGKYLAGSFIFCEAAAFRQVGGFSEELYASEEIELTHRLKRLARQQGKRLAILHRHPLLTSARKARLYSRREYAGFLMRTVLGRGKTLRDPRACFTWYDGRR
jgi:glycosyltransferase involved in cell wall biosynthesis